MLLYWRAILHPLWFLGGVSFWGGREYLESWFWTWLSEQNQCLDIWEYTECPPAFAGSTVINLSICNVQRKVWLSTCQWNGGTTGYTFVSNPKGLQALYHLFWWTRRDLIQTDATSIRKPAGPSCTRYYPLVNVYITMENHHFYSVNQLFLWAIFQFAFSMFTGPGIFGKSWLMAWVRLLSWYPILLPTKITSWSPKTNGWWPSDPLRFL